MQRLRWTVLVIAAAGLALVLSVLVHAHYQKQARINFINSLQRIYDGEGRNIDIHGGPPDLRHLVIDASHSIDTKMHPFEFGTETELRRQLIELGFTKVTLLLEAGTVGGSRREFDLTKPVKYHEPID